MRRTALLLGALAVLALPHVGAVTQRSIDFSPPAQVGPNLNVSAEWAMLVFDAEAGVTGSLRLDDPTLTELTETGVVARPARNSDWWQWQGHPASSSSIDDVRSSLASVGLGSVYLEASRVTLTAADADSTIQAKPGGAALDWLVGKDVATTRAARFDEHRPDGGVAVASGILPHPMAFELRASGISVMETQSLAYDCGACPAGDDREVTTQGVDDTSLEVQRLRFHRFEAVDGELSLSGVAAVLVMGGSEVDVGIDGHARLPLASCIDCEGFESQTLALEGSILLEGLRDAGSGRFEAMMQGSFLTARVDETSVNPSNLGSVPVIATAAASIGILAVLKWLVAPFFTRLSKEKALEHPRRIQIYQYVQQHPGANFREIARMTGIAAGTVRHHLNVMVRSDILLEYVHGSTVRLFENLPRYERDWADHVLLREPALGELYQWLRANPGAPQKAVLEGLEPAGWSRSTTQHRLSRLVDGGLATIKLQGRLKIYTAVDRSARPSTAAGIPGTN